MITHEVPGDSFWDLIRKGAEAAAEKDNIELRYSNDPEAPNQANLVQSAIDSKVDGIAVTLAKPDAMAPAVQAADGRRHPGRWRSTPASTTSRPMGVQEYFGQDEKLAGIAAGEKLTPTAPRRSSASSRSRARSLSNPVVPVSSRASRAPREILNVNSKDMPSVEVDHHRQAAAGSDASTTSSRSVHPIALTAVQSVGNAGSKAKIVTFDTNAALVDAIKNGQVAAGPSTSSRTCRATSPIDSLWLYINNKNLIGGGRRR